MSIIKDLRCHINYRAWLGDTRLEMKNVTRPKVMMSVFGKYHASAAEIFRSLQPCALWCPNVLYLTLLASCQSSFVPQDCYRALLGGNTAS